MEVKNFSEFKNRLVSDTNLQDQFKSDPVKAIQSIEPHNIPDNWVYRIVVGSLGFAVILVIIAVIIITTGGKTNDSNTPTILTAISSGAIGALAGLLAPSPTQSSQ